MIGVFRRRHSHVRRWTDWREVLLGPDMMKNFQIVLVRQPTVEVYVLVYFHDYEQLRLSTENIIYSQHSVWCLVYFLTIIPFHLVILNNATILLIWNQPDICQKSISFEGNLNIYIASFTVPDYLYLYIELYQ